MRSKSQTVNESFQDADRLIVAGQLHRAAQLVLKTPGLTKFNAWSNEQRLEFAELCRRCGLTTLGLKVLSSLVRQDGRLTAGRTEFKVTYAALLIKIGSLSEAIQILEQTNPHTPECDLYIAYANLSRWDHATAALHLEKFLKHSKPSAYQRTVAEVNFAHALVNLGRFEEADRLLVEIQERCRKENWNLLLKNSLEIRSQAATELNNFALAERQLLEAGGGGGRDRYALFVHIQKIRLALQRGKIEDHELKARMKEARDFAFELKHYESLRSLDLLEALTCQSQALADRVYFGSPYSKFQEELKNKAADWYRPSDFYLWNPGPEGKIQNTIDVFHGTVGQTALKAGQGAHRMLMALTRDFYRPIPLGLLHGYLYPGQYLNPVTSPHRLHMAVGRAREWFKELNLPLEISVKDSHYQLHAHEPVGFLLKPAEADGSDDKMKFQVALERAKPHLAMVFSNSEVADALRISLRNANLITKWGCDNKVLERRGQGRGTRYKFSA